jgi:hypothetical protein
MNDAVAGNKAEGATLYYEGCKQAHARSCMAQATMLNDAAIQAVNDPSVKGEHAMHAKARAVMFFRRACELGESKVAFSCVLLGWVGGWGEGDMSVCLCYLCICFYGRVWRTYIHVRLNISVHVSFV